MQRNASTNGVEDKNDSTAVNGPESNMKSIIEKEPVRSSSLVFGYLNLFSDGVVSLLPITVLSYIIMVNSFNRYMLY